MVIDSSLEDKIVQGATVELLNAIYEQDFLNCSYGFRPGRGQHDALDEIGRSICRQPISYVLEADITGYFDSIVREKLMELIERRVRDGSILRLIRKWINLRAIDELQKSLEVLSACQVYLEEVAQPADPREAD